MARLRTLLLHPLPEVRTFLREALADSDLLRVLGEAVTAHEALELLDAIHYGVFFLGLELDQGAGGTREAGGTGGIELARVLSRRNQAPALVFIARDESAAFTAFELGATDYLLWPVTHERLERTMQRLRQFKAHFKEIPVPDLAPKNPEEEEDEVAGEETLKLPLAEDEEDKFLSALRQAWNHDQRFSTIDIEKLAINQDGRTLLLPYDQIIFVEAYEDYSYVHTAAQKFLTSYRMKMLEERLRKHRFFRVHRKYLVNLDMVTEIASLPGSNFMLRTAGKTRIELPISRRRIADLKQILGL